MPPFQYITDLPPQVREVLDVGLQQLWLDTFKTVFTITANEVEAYQTAWLKVFQSAFPGQVQLLPSMQPPTVAASERTAGYWIDVSSIALNDNGVTWIQAMPLGTYHHPVYGEIQITSERVTEFANNVKAKVRDTDLDIDYDHKERTGEAAGWVKDAEARPDGLWIAVEWTRDALSKLKNRAYRYFSPEFVDKWTHPKSKREFKNVLLGGALTNRPFLKDILPINLSEVIRSNEGGNLVNRATMEAIARRLGVNFDSNTSDEELASKLTQAAEQANETAGVTSSGTTPDATAAGGTPPAGASSTQQPTGTQATSPVPPPAQGTQDSGGEGGTQGTQNAGGQTGGQSLSEAHIRRLAETDPVVRELTERLAILETANRLSDLTVQLSEFSRPGRARTMTPAMVDELKVLCAETPKAFSDKLIGFIKRLLDNGVVQMNEYGRTTQTHSNADPVQQFNDAVQAKLNANKELTIGDAAEQVAAENPMLFHEYRERSYAFKREGAS